MLRYKERKLVLKNIFFGSKGFTLVEVLVAMAILMLVIFAYTTLFTSSFENIFRAGERSEKLYLAQQNIEKLMAIHDDGTSQVVALDFDGTEYQIWGRKQEVDALTTFVSEGESELIRFVTVGAGGTIFTSPLGSTWEEIDSGVNNDLNSVTWGGVGEDKLYIAIGSGGSITRSNDGVIWDPNSVSIPSIPYINFNGVTWGGPWEDHLIGIEGKVWFVAVGEKSTIIVSGDGENWITTNSGDSSAPALNGVCWGPISNTEAYFVAVGNNGNIMTWTGESETEDWIKREIVATDKDLYDVFWAQGMFVAVGESGTILFSTDAEIWNEVADSKTTVNLKSITRGYGKYIAVGPSGTIISSEDGQEWQLIPFIDSNENFTDVTWGYNRFIAVSNKSILTSLNGESWSVVKSDTTNLFGVTGR